jgi:hypothetical protein
MIQVWPTHGDQVSMKVPSLGLFCHTGLLSYLKQQILKIDKNRTYNGTLNYQTLSIHVFVLLYQDHISGVMIGMLASSAVDHGFKP